MLQNEKLCFYLAFTRQAESAVVYPTVRHCKLFLFINPLLLPLHSL